jgi:hypothetical protein
MTWQTPVVDGAPVIVEGTPVDPGAAAHITLDEAVRGFQERIRSIQLEEQRRFERSLDRAGQRSLELQRAQLARSVQAELGPAVRAYVADAPQTARLVNELTTSLSRQVEANASEVVKRLASREAATHALSRALEERCLQHVDERIGSFWAGCAAGVAAVALAGMAAGWACGGWSGADSQRGRA